MTESGYQSAAADPKMAGGLQELGESGAVADRDSPRMSAARV